jgi:ribosomal protein L40E
MADPELTARAPTDEQRIAKGVAIGLPLVTLTVAAVVGLLVGPATSILVVAAGLLLGVIALLWASLRVLSGDAPLPPELEALDMAAQGVDALATRKKMLLRALKDLENERGIGKLEDDDFEQIAATYRAELKTVMKRIDEALAPHRARAEETARAHLTKAGLVEVGYRGSLPAEPAAPKASAKDDEPSRKVCPKCKASNEADAKFCKECATKLETGKARDSEPEENSTAQNGATESTAQDGAAGGSDEA